jgi:hypothetical protein
LGRQLLLQLGGASLPEFFHAFFRFRAATRRALRLCWGVTRQSARACRNDRYFTLAEPSYPQAAQEIRRTAI